MSEKRPLRKDETRMPDGHVRRNTWGWKSRPGRFGAITFYGHQPGFAEEGLVAFIRVQFNKLLPFNDAVALAKRQLPPDFTLIDIPPCNKNYYRSLTKNRRPQQLSTNMHVIRRQNAG